MGVHLFLPLKLLAKSIFADATDWVIIGYNTILIAFIPFLTEVEDHIKFAVWLILSILGMILLLYNIRRKKIDNEHRQEELIRKRMENVAYRYETIEVINVAKMLITEEMDELERTMKDKRKQIDDDLKKLSE